MPLSERQRAVLVAVLGRLIPSDQHGPGAHEAGVICYIEEALATDYESDAVLYAKGLERFDLIARSTFGRGFVDLAADEQDTVLAGIEAGAAPGVDAADREFFELVLQHTKEGMFGDPAWGGNIGYVGWKLLDYPGPRHVWTAEDQQLDVVIAPTYEDIAPLPAPGASEEHGPR